MSDPKTVQEMLEELAGGDPIDELAETLDLAHDYVQTGGQEHPSGGTLAIKVLPHHEGLHLPEYKSDLASGFDLIAANNEPIFLNTIGASAMIPTGLCFEIPVGFEGQVRPRSGLAAKHGITVTNTPGTVDADYRGEIKVLLTNIGGKRFTVERGMRIAQMVICPVVQVELEVVEDLSETNRGAGGFGSTGV